MRGLFHKGLVLLSPGLLVSKDRGASQGRQMCAVLCTGLRGAGATRSEPVGALLSEWRPCWAL